MRKCGALLAATIAVIALPTILQAQVCGDVNNSGITDIADMVFLVNYLEFGPPPPYPAVADCDGRAGITLSDEVAILEYLFAGGQLHCTPTGIYSANYTVGDTLFWPFMFDIPDEIDAVSLPVTVMLQPNAQGYYIPFLPKGGLGNVAFRLNSISYSQGSNPIIVHGSMMGDTAVLFTSHFTSQFYTGLSTLFTLNYVRIAPGEGRIAPDVVDRTAQWIPSFERDGDLFRLAVKPTQQYLPVETLVTTPTHLSFASQAGKVAPDSFEVSFASTSLSIDFTIVSPDPWIILKDVPLSGYTTPASVWVKADATALGIGDYTGSIVITPNDSSITTVPDSVTVSFHVTPPIVFPPGDFNCDGICDLTDLSAIISYMTGGGYILKHCNQF